MTNEFEALGIRPELSAESATNPHPVFGGDFEEVHISQIAICQHRQHTPTQAQTSASEITWRRHLRARQTCQRSEPIAREMKADSGSAAALTFTALTFTALTFGVFGFTTLAFTAFTFGIFGFTALAFAILFLFLLFFVGFFTAALTFTALTFTALTFVTISKHVTGT